MAVRLSKTEKRALWLGVGVTVLVLLARLVNIGEGVSLRSLDSLFSYRGPVEQKDLSPIVIVAIDEESFDNMPERWIWPRDFHGRLIDKIMKGRPKVIVFDMTFSEPTAKDPLQDAALAAAARRAGNVIMGAEIVQVIDQMYQSEQLKLPIERLNREVAGIGITNTPKDSDAFVRRTRLLWKVHDKRQYSLALAALRRYLDLGAGEINVEAGRLELGDRVVPLDGEDCMLIDFCGPPKTFKTVPYYQVYTGMFDPANFRDAIVLVGATAEILHDNFDTPFTRGGSLAKMPGVEIHANASECWSAGFPFTAGSRSRS